MSLNRAFEDCKSLKRIVFEKETGTVSGTSAFYSCEQLEEVQILCDSLTVHRSMFESCTRLRSIDFSKITEIHASAFSRCNSLPREIRLSNRLTVLGIGAFSEVHSLQRIFLSEQMHTIEKGTFRDCSGLAQVTVPAGILFIKSGAFQNCTSLQTVFYEGSAEVWDVLFKPENPELDTIEVVCRNTVVYPEGFSASFAEIMIADDTIFEELDPLLNPTGQITGLTDYEIRIVHQVAVSETHCIVIHRNWIEDKFYFCRIPLTSVTYAPQSQP